MNTLVSKKLIRWLGIAVALAAGAYFVMHAHQALRGQDLGALLQGQVILAAALLTLTYMVSIPVTALAWSGLLRALGQPAAVSVTAPILATTQLGKYLPGNVAHHLGRVFVARTQGIDAGRTLLSMAYETLLLLVACAHVSSLTLLWSPPAALAELSQHHGALVVLVSMGALLVIVAAPAVAQAIARLRGVAPADTVRAVRPAWLTCFVCYLLYALNFAMVGAGLWLVARVLSPEPVATAELVLLTGAFAGSWILGFLAPGAPAGLGVREAVLSFWLGSAFPASVSVSLIILLRIATTAGDLLNFLWGSLALARLRHPR